MVIEPLFYVVALLSVFVHGMGKAGFGMGLPILAIPMMSLFISPIQALSILVIPLIFMDLITIHRFKGLWNKEILKFIIPFSLLGIVIVTITFQYLSENSLRVIVFITPAFIVLFIFILYPVFETIRLSFYDKFGREFVGLYNYKWAVNDPEFRRSIFNNLVWLLVVPTLSTFFGCENHLKNAFFSGLLVRAYSRLPAQQNPSTLPLFSKSRNRVWVLPSPDFTERAPPLATRTLCRSWDEVLPIS